MANFATCFTWQNGGKLEPRDDVAPFELAIPKDQLAGEDHLKLRLDVVVRVDEDPKFICAGKPFEATSDINTGGQ